MSDTISGSDSLLRNTDVGHMLELREKLAASDAKCQELLVALHDAIRRPMGVVPYSAEKFYIAP